MDDMDELMKEYASRNDVESAIEEKNAGEFIDDESIDEIVKDYPSAQKELDLHKRTGSEAQSDIRNFIRTSGRQNLKTVRLITGKGTGVILEVTEQLLSSLKKDGLILGFRKEKTGGSFAVYLR
jgi:DNA-nicking Smr family endonuclease